MDGVYGLTGPLYERRMPSLPRANEGHRVPSGYWKIRAIRDGFTTTVAAFIFEQETPRHAKYCAHLTTVDEVERRKWVEFLPRAQPNGAGPVGGPSWHVGGSTWVLALRLA